MNHHVRILLSSRSRIKTDNIQVGIQGAAGQTDPLTARLNHIADAIDRQKKAADEMESLTKAMSDTMVTKDTHEKMKVDFSASLRTLQANLLGEVNAKWGDFGKLLNDKLGEYHTDMMTTFKEEAKSSMKIVREEFEETMDTRLDEHSAGEREVVQKMMTETVKGFVTRDEWTTQWGKMEDPRTVVKEEMKGYVSRQDFEDLEKRLRGEFMTQAHGLKTADLILTLGREQVEHHQKFANHMLMQDGLIMHAVRQGLDGATVSDFNTSFSDVTDCKTDIAAFHKG